MKLRIIATAIGVACAALLYTTTAGAPNRPPPSSCPSGYEKDSGSSDRMLLCTRTVTRDRDRVVYVEVPGPERVVEKIVYVDREVPGPERVVTKVKVKRVVQFKTKVKRVVKVKYVTRYRNCPKPPYPPAG